jgi:hypothetical protein
MTKKKGQTVKSKKEEHVDPDGIDRRAERRLSNVDREL